MAQIKCKECGHAMEEGTEKCPVCGCQNRREENPHDSVSARVERRKKKKVVWTLTFLLLCLIGGGAYFSFSDSGKGENLLPERNKNNAVTNQTDCPQAEKDTEERVELTPEFEKNISKYRQMGMFSEGYAAVSKGNNRWGYINTKGQEAIPSDIAAYGVGRFSEGLAYVASWDKDCVINKKCEVVFQLDTCYYKTDFIVAQFLDDKDLPYYIGGKLYVFVEHDYNVYDTRGRNLGKASIATVHNIYKQQKQKGEYTTMTDNRLHYEGEGLYSTQDPIGLKDSKGRTILQAEYDYINGNYLGGDKVDFSNGVVLVVLSAAENDDKYLNETYKGVCGFSGYVTYYYGYADAKGHVTFPDKLIQKCRESKARYKK